MKKVSVFIDGYNLYHAVSVLQKPYLKWVNPRELCRFFITDKFEVIDACGKVNRNKQGQTYFKTSMIKEFMLEESIMPEVITLPSGKQIFIPTEYRR